MPSQFSLRVIHPAFELLKRSAPMLHFIAASIILVNGLHHFNNHHISRLICYCQLLIATDIYLLLFFITLGMLADIIYLNCIFRFIEAATLLGIGFLLIGDGHTILSRLHFLLSAGYAFIFYREYRIQRSETIDIKHTGITIPNFKADAEIAWQDIKTVEPHYHSILIETLRHQKIQFQLRDNLNMEELQLIDDFCRQHQVSA